MSEQYVQTIDELRSEYVEACAEQYGFADLYAQDWDRAIAAHDREVKAEALREAADRLPGATEGSSREGTAKWPAHCRDAYSLAIEEAQQVLRAIATNTIESEARP